MNTTQVSYVEAHGTGTKVGDPQEAGAITQVLCADRTTEQLPLLIGALKSNMGHPETAAGIASMAKVTVIIICPLLYNVFSFRCSLAYITAQFRRICTTRSRIR